MRGTRGVIGNPVMRFVFLHGHGQHPVLFRSLTKSLVKKFKEHAVFFPPGFHMPMKTYAPQPEGRAWYKYPSGGGRKVVGDRVIHSDRDYDKFASTHLSPDGQTVLVGFSEGGRFAINVASRYPDRVAGLVLMCFPLPEEDRTDIERRGALCMPVTFVTSTHDNIVNQSDCEAARRLFQSETRVLVHEKGHKVFLGARVRDPIFEMFG